MKMLKVSEIIDAMIRNWGNPSQESTPELYFAPDHTRRAVWNVINRFYNSNMSAPEVYTKAAKYARSTGN